MLRRTRLAIAGLAVASVIGAGAVAGTIVTASAHERFAKATLRTADGSRVGTVAFERDRGSTTPRSPSGSVTQTRSRPSTASTSTPMTPAPTAMAASPTRRSLRRRGEVRG